jgi:hypothetical protein
MPPPKRERGTSNFSLSRLTGTDKYKTGDEEESSTKDSVDDQENQETFLGMLFGPLLQKSIRTSAISQRERHNPAASAN